MPAVTDSPSTASTGALLLTAMENRDPDALIALLADDVVLHSPVTPRHFEGKAEVSELFRTLTATIESYEPTWSTAGEDFFAFTVRARWAGREVELMDLIRFDSEGKVRELRIHGRPLSGVAALAAAAAPHIARPRGRLRTSLTRAVSRPLPGLLERGDRLVMRLARG